MQKNNKAAFISVVVFGLFSSYSHAALTNYTSAGSEVVYSSAGGISWTKDANLLGSMFNSQGFSTVVNAIIGSYSGSYALTVGDFESDGAATWVGANAFIGYLNSVSYAGTNQWRLPAIIDTGSTGCNYSNNGTDCGYNVDTSTGEMAKLYFDELGGQAVNDTQGNYQPDVDGIPDTAFFDNEVQDIYWSSLQSATPGGAWIFATDDGVQMDGFSKTSHTYVWAVTSALTVTAVPEADSVAMLMAGLGLLGLMARRKQSV